MKKITKECKYRNCKNEIPRGMRSYCSPQCQELEKKAVAKERNSVKIGTTNRLTSYKTLKQKAWYEFSRYIRMKYADENGVVMCVTCGTPMMWNDKMQAGHAIQGRGNFILFNEKFVYPQCQCCNIFKGGNYQRFTVYLLKNGIMTLEEFEQAEIDSRKPYKIHISDMEMLYWKYKELAQKEEDRING